MMTVLYKPNFVRQYKKLPRALQEEVKEKLEVFREHPTHSSLKAHKLHGRLKGCMSFSVNYRYRIVYEVTAKKTVALLAVGDHDIYQ